MKSSTINFLYGHNEIRNILIIFFLFSLNFCKPVSSFGQLSQKEKEKLSEKYFDKAMSYENNQGCLIQTQYLDSALYYNPKNSDAYLEKAAWMIKIGNYVNFFNYINKAVEIDPQFHLGYRGWIKLYNLRDYDGAIEDLTRLLNEYKVISAWGENVNYLLGLAKKQKGDFKGSIIEFDLYINDVSKKQGEKWVDIYAFVYRGISKMKLNRYSDAIKDFDSAIKNYDKCAEAYYYKGYSLTKLNKPKEACLHLKKALILLSEGNTKKDVYKEVFDQLYAEDIERLLKLNCEGI